MRLMIAMAFVALGSVGTAQAQKIDCHKIVASCTGSQSLAKFGSALSCLKRAPAPIQRACASVISKYNVCASKCDKGRRGSLCRSKCSSVAKSSAKPKSARPVLKKPVVRKAGPSLKRPKGKPVRPIAKPKTGKYQGTKTAPVKRPGSKVQPIAKPKTGKYQGTKGPSVTQPTTGVRKAPIVKSKKPYSPKQGIKLKSGPTKKTSGASVKPVKDPADRSIKAKSSKSGALNKKSNTTPVKKNYKIKKRLPVKKVAPRPVPRKAAATTGGSKAKARPSAKSLRSKSGGIRGLKTKSGGLQRAPIVQPKSKSKVTAKKGATKNIGHCKKDSRGKLVCKPVKSKRPTSKK